MIPREFIEDVKYRNDIVEVIGSYVTLKRAGSNFNGLCPFHSEKSPSFTVFPATSSFYCFGCGAGGEVLTFIMKAENLDYVSAVEFLAKRVGLTVPRTEQPRENGMSRQRVLDMNLEAARFFRNCLFDPSIGKAGMDYLAGTRKLSSATIKHFGLGFAPDDFGMLTDHLRRCGFTEDEMVTGYMAGRSQKNGRIYSLFRNRVMFPIIDTTGNIVAFGGRVMDDSKPKYLNSSDTPGFKKSRHLFALNYARNCSSEQMILCEGYMDVIALHAAGFENAVATLGTAITSEQARIFAKYTKKVIISYDSDEAGQNAANKAMRLLGEVGLDVRILRMTGAKDPDEYIKKFGADRFRQVLEQSRSGFAFKLEGILSKHDVSLPEEKIKAASAACDVIADFYSPVEREVYLSEASKALDVPVDVLRNNVELILKHRLREQKKQEGHDAQISLKNIGDRVNPDAAKNVMASAAEEAILGLLMLYEEYRNEVVSGKVALTADDFFTDFGRRVFVAVMEQTAEGNGFSFSVMGERFSPDEMGRMEYMMQNRRQLSRNDESVLRECIERLREAGTMDTGASSGDIRSDIERIRQKQAESRKK